jgi:hypothetical protein
MRPATDESTAALLSRLAAGGAPPDPRPPRAPAALAAARGRLSPAFACEHEGRRAPLIAVAEAAQRAGAPRLAVALWFSPHEGAEPLRHWFLRFGEQRHLADDDAVLQIAHNAETPLGALDEDGDVAGEGEEGAGAGVGAGAGKGAGAGEGEEGAGAGAGAEEALAPLEFVVRAGQGFEAPGGVVDAMLAAGLLERGRELRGGRRSFVLRCDARWARPCNACDRLGAPLRCARCLRVSYCDEACQRLDWKKRGHRDVCVEPLP